METINLYNLNKHEHIGIEYWPHQKEIYLDAEFYTDRDNIYEQITLEDLKKMYNKIGNLIELIEKKE